MSVFKTEKMVPVTVPDLEPVIDELVSHFRQREYQVEKTHTDLQEWEVGITRGGMFKATFGLRTALKITVETRATGTMVRAGTGIFGKQAVPTALTMLVAWPVVFAQVWGLVRQAGLDDEAVRVVELSLTRIKRLGDLGGELPAPDLPAAPDGTQPTPAMFCTGCGQGLGPQSRFCPQCGTPNGQG